MNAIYKYRVWKFLLNRKNKLLFNIFLTSMAEIEGFHIFYLLGASMTRPETNGQAYR